MRAGLVSITFRNLSPAALVEKAVASGLACVEWGGDVHVPHGELDTARAVGCLTRTRGLEVSAYGSYYALGESEQLGLSFTRVLESAVALGAPVIRVWAGKKGSAEADAAYRETVARDALRIADLSQREGVSIAYEFHSGSLTDTASSARALLDATAHPAIFTLWQPPNGRTEEECLEGLELVISRLSHVHAFHWWPDAAHRLPLAEGAARWRRYLSFLRSAGKNPDVLLEFVPGDDPGVLRREAETLCGLLEFSRPSQEHGLPGNG